MYQKQAFQSPVALTVATNSHIDQFWKKKLEMIPALNIGLADKR